MSQAELFTATPAAKSRATPRDLVDTFQRDLLRLTFVLTGSAAVALYLTRDVLLDVLIDTDMDDEEVDPNSWSLLQIALGRRYMQGADPEGEPDETDDVQRVRLREAVELLSRPMRTALVLRDLGGLNERDVADITGIEPEELDDVLGWSRARLREAAGRFSGQPPARLLASLAVDAPRRDLWPELAPVIQEHESNRKRRSRLLLTGTCSFLLVFALSGVVWFLGDVPFVGSAERNEPPDDDIAITGDPPPTRPPLPTATPAPTPTSVELIDAALGSDLLIQGFLVDENSRGTGERVAFAFEPGAAQPLVEVQAPSYTSRYASPDGRWTVLFRERYEENVETDDPDDTIRIRTISATLDGEDMGWEYEPPPSIGGGDSAIVGDRLYFLSDTPEPATITVIDLMSGETVGLKTLDESQLEANLPGGSGPPPEGNWSVNVGLFTIADASDPGLYGYLTMLEYSEDIIDRWTRWVFRIDLEDLQPSLVSTISVTDADASRKDDVVQPDIPLYNARMLPDGTGLYALNQTGQQMEVRILDFESGEVESFSTSFATLMDFNVNQTYLQTIKSNDGRKVYILSGLSGEVAIVDLVSRQIERTFPLDLAGLRSKPIQARGLLHLSHDGRRFYITDRAATRTARLSVFTPVWIVDMTTWSIEHQLDVPGYIVSLYPDPDGRSLHVVTQVENLRDPERLRDRLLTYDIGNWEIAESWELSDLVDQNASFQLLSTSDSYREMYGRAPVIDGVEPGDVEDYTTLPLARVVTEEERIPVGVTRLVELEFLDPATGEPLNGADPRVRYDPDQPVTLVFEQPGAKSLISVSAELGPGHQRGTVRLKAAGFWDARIVSGDGGDGFTLVLPDVLRGSPTFEADDGNFYDLRLEASSEESAPDSEIVVRATFADAVTGEPLPDGVTLVDGLPETLRLALVGTGAHNRNLDAAGHGVYEATISIEDPGPWSARLIFRQPESDDTRSTQIEMGTLEFTELSPP